jgi:hypothetical protein
MAKKLSPFEEAFKEARADGRKTFTFNGKSYGTTTSDEVTAAIQKRVDAIPARVPEAPTGIQAGTRYVNFPHTPTPSPAQARSLVDQGRDVDIYKDVDRNAVLEAGLGLAALHPAVQGLRMARPVVGAILKKEFSEDGLFPTFNREKEPPLSTYDTLNPESQAVSRQYRSAYDDRPGPMKKGGAVKKMASGGKVSSASSRGDGIAQRGKTKGRMC